MREDYFDSIIRQKLQGLEVPVDPNDWTLLLEALEQAFDAEIRAKLTALAIPFQAEDWELLRSQLNASFDRIVEEKLSGLALPPEAGDWSELAARLAGQPIDLAILQALESLNIPFDGTAWQDMNGLLDAENPLDHIVRGKLSEHEAAQMPGDWALFESEMDQAFDHSFKARLTDHQVPFIPEDWPPLAVQLDDHPFDAEIRNRLEHFELDKVAGWPLMNEKLNQPFDTYLREQLAGFSVPYLQKDWKQLAARLDQQAAQTERPLIWYRNWRNYTAAAAVVLLMLLSVMGGSETMPIRPDTISRWKQKVPFIRKSQPDALDQSADANDSDSNVNLNQANLAVIPMTPDPNQALQQTQTVDLQGQSANIRPIKTQSELAVVDNPGIAATSWAEKYADLHDGDRIPHEQDPGSADYLFSHLTSDNLRRVGPLSFAEPLFNSFDFSGKEPSRTWEVKRQLPHIRFGFYGANARTRAEMTSSEAYSGYAMGTRFEVKLNQYLWLVTGLQYSEKRFGYDYWVFLNRFQFLENAMDAQLFMVEAPLQLRYYLKQKKHFKYYAQGGLVVQVSTQENYWHYSPETPLNQRFTNSGNSISEVRSLSPEKYERSFNTYVGNLQAALGIEYDINKRLTVQLEPYMLLNLQPTKGAGSLNAHKRPSTLGIGFSVLYNLNNGVENP